MRPIVLAPLLLLVLGAPAAQGATVTTESECYGERPPICRDELRYTAEPGEANRLTGTPDGAGFVVLRDEAAVLRASGRCTQVDDHSARCPAPGARVETGDGDDIVRVVAAVDLGAGDDRYESVETEDGLSRGISGGPGDDTLVGNEYSDGLDGGPGADVIRSGGGADGISGGPGRDLLEGGAGDDFLAVDDNPHTRFSPESARTDYAPEADRADGGPGVDLVSWWHTTHPVEVDLADPGPDGSAGEGDVVVAIEGVWGGRADDRLSGDDGANVMWGAGGTNVIIGRGGDDRIDDGGGPRRASRIDAGPGDDQVTATGARVTAGPGDDRIHLDEEVPGPGGRVRCGSGADHVHVENSTPRLVDCERFALPYGDLTVGLVPRLTASGAAFTVFCTRRCRGQLRLVDGRRRVVGGARFRRPRRGWFVARVALPRRVHRRLRSSRGWRGTVRVGHAERGVPPLGGRVVANLRAR